MAISVMQRTHVVSLDRQLALVAADLSLEHGLAMADAMVLATARTLNAELITSDQDFDGIPMVTYLPKKSAGP
jgi:predicted nucleic acid-binding protein